MQEQIDIAIVGAGVSGLYSAWRLKQQLPDRTIVVFEGSDRVGGRLLSVRPPGIDDMVAELGGMRILPSTQPLITHLIEELNDTLGPQEQIELYDFPVDQPQNIAYLRGTHLRLSDFTTEPAEVPYALSFLEQGTSPGGLIVNAIEQIVPGITTEPDEAKRRLMAQEAVFGGEPLYQQGFWNVLLRIMTGEAYQLGIDAGGYQSTLCNWNAADAIPWYLSDFGIKPEYKGFCKGYDQVPKTLAAQFRAAGGEIHTNTRVDGFEWAGESSEDKVVLRIGKQRIGAQAIILAMPRRSLDLLSSGSPPLQAREVTELIRSVTPRPLFKLFTTYESPWWRAAGYTDTDGQFVPVEAGRTVTDLPVRQTYYWPKDNGQPATSGPSMLMASYDDGNNTGFWDGLRARRGRAWALGVEVTDPEDPFIGDMKDSGELEWFQYRASVGMVAEVARQLASIHGLPYAPAVRNAAFRDWGDDPFGGGWNSWNIGVKSWEVKGQIVQPAEGRPLFICGEAYSDAQGWVEGALQTADMMLERFWDQLGPG